MMLFMMSRDPFNLADVNDEETTGVSQSFPGVVAIKNPPDGSHPKTSQEAYAQARPFNGRFYRWRRRHFERLEQSARLSERALRR